jgi:PKD repeat protein
VTTPFAHSETTDQCITCHNGNIATGKSGGHPISTNNCDGCHIAGAGWGSFLQPIDHSQTQDICTRCHGSVAQGKPGNHPNTSDVCEACHDTSQWLPVLTPFDHSQADTTTCETAGCHSLPGGHCTITAPLGNECSQCHNTGGWTSAQTCDLTPNSPPTAVITGPTSAGVGDTLTFDASASFDPDQDPLTYSWTIEGQNYSGVQISHTFNNAGNVIVSLVVNDGQASSSDQLTVTVSNQPPVNQAPTAMINGPNSGNEGDSLTFDGSGSSDPDGSISSYSWTIEGQNYSGVSATHTFNNPGNVQVSLVVTDNAGADSPQATHNVNITAQVNLPPTVVINGPASGCVNQALAYTSNAQDPENDQLSYQWYVTPAGTASFSTPKQANTNITFTTMGNKTVILEVTDTAQNTTSDSLAVNIQNMMCM